MPPVARPYLARPDFAFQLAFNADPNDPAATPTWVDFTKWWRTASAISRGRVYELAQSTAASPSFNLREVDELLNPFNASSPYVGQILPYRSALLQGMWPNGGTGNLLNANTWVGNNLADYDPSFEAYGLGVTPWWVTFVGVTSAGVHTGNPHSGAQSYVVTVAAGTTVPVVTYTVPCMPGRQYTATAWVRQTAANSTGIAVVGGTVGTNTSAVNTYTRLAVTFTATQPSHQIEVIGLSATFLAATVNIDDVQHEPGAAATTFSTSGPVIYPIERGYAERYRRTWDSAGFEGLVGIPCVDSFAALAATQIESELVMAMQNFSPAPAYLWLLADGENTTAFSETSGNNGPPMAVYKSKNGSASGTVTGGSPMNITGAAGLTGVDISGSDVVNNKGRCLGVGATGTPLAGVGGSGSGWGWSVGFWIQYDSGIPTASSPTMVLSGKQMSFELHTQPDGSLRFEVEWRTQGLAYANVGAAGVVANDGLAHFIVVNWQLTSGTLTTRIYVDGVSYLTDTQSCFSVFNATTIPATMTALELGGAFDSFNTLGGQNGTYAVVGVWPNTVASAIAVPLWAVGGVGFAGETSGQRIARHLALGGYTPPTRISVGTATMEAPTYEAQIDLLTDAQNTATAENGIIWTAPDGAFVFEGRADRFLRTTPVAVFGENVASGEIPYTADPGDIEYDVDPVYLYSNVKLARNGGATVTGGAAADIAAAVRRQFARTYGPVGVDLQDDAQAQYLADWTFYTHYKSLPRIAALQVDAGRVGATTIGGKSVWDWILGLEIGQRVTVNRRPKAANAGAGIVMSSDFFIEQITHDGVDADAGTWTTTFYVSPVGSSAQGVSMQPWILGDSTYGVLDSTTVIGF